MNLKKKRYIWGSIAILAGIIGIIVLYVSVTASPLHFVSQRNIEINSVVDFSSFVKDVKDGNLEDVTIDSSAVNVKKIGEYNVIYKYHDKEYSLKVKVVDTTPPTFDVQSKSVALHQTIAPEQLVKNVKDSSQTQVTFAKKYTFDELGEKEVEIIVTDEYDNQTTQKTKVKVVEDKKAPEIIVGNASVIVGNDIDLNALASVKDDFDPKPTLKIEKNELDIQKKGNYKVKYIAEDVSGNRSEKEITIQVIDKTGEDEKVVYLTFDDGPSRYTPEVLDILERYHCKAAFFITGMNSSYRKYISTAHNQGHTIGLHTYSHSYSKVYSSTEAYFQDLEKVGQLAKDYIGFVPKYIRFPGGSSNLVSKKYTPGIMTKLSKMVEDKGYIYYDWNAENGDGYAKMSQSEMLKRATSSSEKKIMILMHDANGKQNTVDILPKVIEHYQKKGYTFKAIDDSAIVPHQHINN
ncbi:polysaccharide deacetylase family protein [Candidatus Stoquefichus massiliensis]|uniref:polysaccharide deacetylase family protein n=1 Tax=Candidatus Stoquefichus massiliensis TaxID=1470350 RepID=UPI0004812EFC|nr:polysaccharide deacetylase family protein [Candidatus Stoquefichus massiliensis]